MCVDEDFSLNHTETESTRGVEDKIADSHKKGRVE